MRLDCTRLAEANPSSTQGTAAHRAVRWVIAWCVVSAACTRATANRDLEPSLVEAPPAPELATATVAAPPPSPPDSVSPDSVSPEVLVLDTAQADLDPDNDWTVAPPEALADCEARLQRAGVEFRAASFPLKQKRGSVFTCGTEQAVIFQRGPEALRWSSRPHVTCRMALALARFEQILKAEAQKHLGRPVRKVTQGGTYSCRKMQRFANMVSEHSYANAIDIRAFELAGGKSVSVLAHFGALDTEPAAVESLFLRSQARRLYDENVFSVVLTPYFDALHHDHFHLDLARYRLDGTR